MGSYILSTHEEQQQMLSAIGVKDVRELYSDVPQDLMLDKLDIPDGKSEMEVCRIMEEMAEKNHLFRCIFRGAGAYDHYIPAIVRQILSKEEFITAYTPYQAEISQGLLQSIFEYQTMVAELTGMDVSNASVYDGATAVAEACTMCRTRKKDKSLISAALHPDYIATVKTYCSAGDKPMDIIPMKDGKTDIEALKEMLTPDVACVAIAQPNYYGQFEDAEAIAEIVHEAGAKFIISFNPISLGMFKSPGELGADVAVGEGQPLGLTLEFGGPYLGLMAAKSDLIRQMPGRIVGETVDTEGKRGYILTLQAREQHIKREKATSSICSNEALCALTASVYLAAMGPQGLRKAAEQSYAKAHYLAEKLCAIKGIRLVYKGEFFNEFVTECDFAPRQLIDFLAYEHEILGGLTISENQILWCCTEKNTKADMDKLVALVEKFAEEVVK